MKAKQKALGSAIPHIGAKALNGRKTDVDRVSLLGFSGQKNYNILGSFSSLVDVSG